jgi:hypothetical protein
MEFPKRLEKYTQDKLLSMTAIEIRQLEKDENIRIFFGPKIKSTIFSLIKKLGFYIVISKINQNEYNIIPEYIEDYVDKISRDKIFFIDYKVYKPMNNIQRLEFLLNALQIPIIPIIDYYDWLRECNALEWDRFMSRLYPGKL